jgi:hypothetical protein
MLRMAIALPIYLGILSYIFWKKDQSKVLTQTTSSISQGKIPWIRKKQN